LILMSNIKNEPSVYIVILNWNGWQDTIECLESVFRIEYTNYRIILIDNDSANNSTEHIQNWLILHDSGVRCNEMHNETQVIARSNKVLFLKNSENFGFAKGNNIGIRFTLSDTPDFYLLLNNDTVVEPDFLRHLTQSYINQPDLAAVIPQIRLHPQTDYIWNCGGKISFGFRKYFYQGAHFQSVPTNRELQISYATGCALLFKPQQNGMLSEDFFFGEEDFEYAYRMKNAGLKMVCNTNSILFHKVGKSSKGKDIQTNKGTTFIHYLNRFVNMKHQFENKIVWYLWRILYVPYIFLLLRKRFGSREVINFIKLLFIKSTKLDKVNKNEFEQARTSADYFKLK